MVLLLRVAPWNEPAPNSREQPETRRQTEKVSP
jgi:hypothetical protein